MGVNGNYEVLTGIIFPAYYVTMKAEKDPILPEIEGFLDRHAVGETIFGRDAAGDTHLIYDLREGRKLRRATRRKIEQFMKGYKNGRSTSAR